MITEKEKSFAQMKMLDKFIEDLNIISQGMSLCDLCDDAKLVLKLKTHLSNASFIRELVVLSPHPAEEIPNDGR